MRNLDATTDAPTDFWGMLATWAGEAGMNIVVIMAIIVGCVIAAWLLRFVIRRVVRRIVNGAKTKANVDDTQALDRSPFAAVRVVQRTRTLGTILQGVVNVTLFIVAVLLIIQHLNSAILGSLTLLTAAIGAGLGFGAQNIVRDALNGMFIVAGDQLGIGDVVDLGLATGVVEHVSVRVTHVRDVNGTLWYVRNGEILRIGNMSMGWARVIIDASVDRSVPTRDIEETMLDVATALMQDSKWRSRVVERPEMWGLESIATDAQVVRIVMRTRSNARDDVAQELRTRLKFAFDEAGIELVGLATSVLDGPEGAQRVRGANPPKTRPTPVTAPPSSKKPRLPKRPRKQVPVVDEKDPQTKPFTTAPDEKPSDDT